MGQRSEQKRQTRQAILEAAIGLSVDRGFSSISLREVAAEAGIAPTSFYRHFDNMDALGLAIVDEVGRSLRELVRDARNRVISGQASVTRASIEAFFDYLDENGNVFRLSFGQVMAGAPHMRQAITTEINLFIDELSEDLHTASVVRRRPLWNIPAVAEAMTWLVFNRGIQTLDLTPKQRQKEMEKIIAQVRIMMKGAEAEAQGWEPEPTKA